MNMWESIPLAAMDPGDKLWIGVCLGVLVVLIVVAFVVLRTLRNRLDSSHCDSRFETAFTLDQLRQWHRQGQISDKEYQNLRDTILNGNKTPEE